MFFKSENEKINDESQIILTIKSENELDHCINQLNASTNITRCVLDVTWENLPHEKRSALDEAIIKQISINTLTHLDLRGIYYDCIESIISSLPNNTSLKFLNLSSFSSYEFTSAGIIFNLLEQNTILEEIHIDDCSIAPFKLACSLYAREEFKQALKYLAKTKTIKELQLFFQNFIPHDHDIKILAQLIKQLPLNTLKLNYCSYFPLLCQQSLLQHDTLTTLAYKGNFYFNIGSIDALIELIKSNTRLTSLSFSLAEINDGSSPSKLLELGQAIGQNQTLTHLDLNYNDIKEMSILVDIIHNNKSLKSLDFSNNPLSHNPDAVVSLLNSIAENHMLEDLNLCKNQIKFSENSHLFITKNKSLTSFKILEQEDWCDDHPGENKITYTSLSSIKQAIEQNLFQKFYPHFLLINHIIRQQYKLPEDINISLLRLFLETFKKSEIEGVEKIIKKNRLIAENTATSKSLVEENTSTCNLF